MKTKKKIQVMNELLEYLSEFNDEDKSKILSYVYNQLRKKLRKTNEKEKQI